MAHASWVTALSWASFGSSLLLATGCAEGSVRLYAACAATLSALPDATADPSAGPADKVMLLVRVIAAPDLRQVTCVDLRTQTSSSTGGPPSAWVYTASSFMHCWDPVNRESAFLSMLSNAECMGLQSPMSISG